MIKVAILGAGSAAFSHQTFRQILGVPEFRDNIHFSGFDINATTLGYWHQRCTKDLAENKSKSKVSISTHPRTVLKDAKYIFSFVRPGGLAAFQNDIDIPLKYMIDQGPADTAGVASIMYAQRGIPLTLDLCRMMREVSAPDCILFNHANPVTMITWAGLKYGGVNTIGLCHGVEGTFRQIARVMGVPREELDGYAAGVNHMSWFVKLLHKNRVVSGKELLAIMEKDPELIKMHDPVRVDLLRQFGCYCTESNGHSSDAFAWYRKRPSDIRNWIRDSDPLNGETGGILRSTMEGHQWWGQHYPKWLSEPAQPFTYFHGEHGPCIMEALETGRIYKGHFNRLNTGLITNLPADCITESPGFVDRTGLHMAHVGDIPMGCAAACNAQVSVHRLAVEAAVHGDDELLRQAFLMDPLTGAVCNPPEVRQMVDELLIAHERFLPQYKKAIVAARQRLAKGPRVKTYDFKGTMRFKVRTLEQSASGKLIPMPSGKGRKS